MEKDKKRTLTISSNLKKKIDTSSISSHGKKSFAVDKKNLLGITKHLVNHPKHLILLIQRKKILQGSLLNNKQQKILSKKIISQQVKVS